MLGVKNRFHKAKIKVLAALCSFWSLLGTVCLYLPGGSPFALSDSGAFFCCLVALTSTSRQYYIIGGDGWTVSIPPLHLSLVSSL